MRRCQQNIVCDLTGTGRPVRPVLFCACLGGDLVALPLAAPDLPRGRPRAGRQLGMQVQFVDVDALVAGEGGVAGPRLQAQPALILELPLPQVLAQFGSAVFVKREPS